jgi:hypothetical protein
VTVYATRPAPHALRAFLLAAFAVGSVACKQDPAPPPKPKDPEPTIVPETVPIRLLFVALRSDSKDPAAPPRTEADAEARAREARAKVLAPGGSFAAVAREMSDDLLSATDEGFHGFVHDRSREPAAIVKAARALKVGEVSEPIATARGSHLLQRLSREEGRALEARYVVPMEGVVCPWHDLQTSLPHGLTKDVAYERAVKVVSELRAGRISRMEDAAARIDAGQPLALPFRKTPRVGFERVSDVALALKAGEVCDPVETARGWYVGRRLAYVRCTARHFLFTSEESPAFLAPSKRTIAEAAQLAETTLATLKKDPSAWNRLVREVSDDVATRIVDGWVGDLSNVLEPGPDRAAPEFEEAAWKLEPGATSGIVETRLGLHLIRRDD